MKKLSISILLLFVMILSITAVAAADDVTSDLAKSQTVDESAALAVDSNTVLAAGETNFTTVQGLVDSASAGIPVTLDTTYTREATDKAILIDKEVTISGGKLDANNLGGIFNITSNGKLTLANVELIKGNSTSGAIYNNGQLTLSAVTFTTTTNSSTIYNDVGGTLTIAFATKAVTFDAGSDYAIYNKGTVTSIDQANLTNGAIYNNGTIDSIANAKINKIDNDATITAINVATPIANINNNGTIASMKGKYGTVTNNGEIETIADSELTTLKNNGTVISVKNSTVSTIENTVNGTIGAIINTNVTNNFATDGAVYNIADSKFDGQIIINTNGSIGTIYNVSADAFDNYGVAGFIANSNFTQFFWNEHENVTVLAVDNIITGIGCFKGNTTSVTNSVFNQRLEIPGNVETVDNITVESYVIVQGNVSEISDFAVKSIFTNTGNIGTLINANVTGAVTNDGNITEIDDSVFGAAFTNNGNVYYGIENLTVAGDFINEGNISDIEEITINGDAWNTEKGFIDSIENVTFAKEFMNDGLISEIEDAIFNGTVDNDGTIDYVDTATFKGAVTNTGNLTVEYADFLAVAVNNNAGNMSVYYGVFNASNIVNSGNLLVVDSVLFNNTVTAISNTGNLIVMDTDFINNTGNTGAILNKGNATVDGSAFYGNIASFGGAIFTQSGKLTVSDSYFINNSAKFGGAVQVDENCVAKIIDSYFYNNTATSKGKSIYNEGNLTLSGNEIFNATVAEIENNLGFITAVKITVLNNGTVYNHAEPVTLEATLTDVDGNWILDSVDAFKFVINGTEIVGTGVEYKYNATTGVYNCTFTPAQFVNITNADQVVTAKLATKYVNATLDVINGTLKTIKGTFTELQYLVNKTAAAGTLVLPYNFAYNAEFDNVNLTKGVVINKAITIDGNGSTISGSDAARIFFVNNTDYRVELTNITFTNGKASNGAAICYNGSYFKMSDCTFTDNVASENGGAIFVNGTNFDVYNSKFANNAPNAIYLADGTMFLKNNTISKTVADVVVGKGKFYATEFNATVLEGKTVNITYGELVTLTAVITDDNGNLINDPAVLFEVDGKKIPAIYDDGKYEFETNLYLTPGTVYPVTLYYNSTAQANKFTPDSKFGALNVSKEEAVIVIFAKDVVAGQNATIELMAFGANGDDLNNTNVTIVVNNVPYNVTIIDGEGNITLPVLDLGTYRVYANYAGDENHNASSQVAEFGVKIATVMTISATNAGYDSALIKVTLTDASGNKLSKFVKVYVADGVYEVAVKDGEGSTLVTGLKPGAYIADAEFAFDSEYADASAQTTFTVQPAQIVVTDMKRGWNSPYDYYATLLDAKGNPVAGKEITFTIDGVTYKATTNASGIATVAAKLDVGTHTVTVTNPDTGANSTATTTIVERIQGYGNITKDYLGPESYIVQVFGDDGNPVGENVVVEVRFAGKTYEMLTNASGYIVRTINFVPGFYAVYSVYAGYQTIQTAIVVNQILKVSAVTVKKSAKSFKLTATLKSSDGKAISGKEIKFTFAGKTYKAKTNSNGVATYKLGSAVIKKLKAGKKYTYKATYVNDIVKGKITVKK